MRLYLIAFLLVCLGFGASAQTDTSLNQYTGLYKFPEGSATPSVDISIQNSALYASSSIGSATMVRMGRDTFSLPDHGGTAYFFRNEAGHVTRIRVLVGELDLEGTREGGPIAWIRRSPLRKEEVK